VSRPKRKRGVPLYVWVSQDEYDAIQRRMEENLSAYIRKMALNGYVLNVDLTPVRELISLQRRCSDNLNQVAFTQIPMECIRQKLRLCKKIMRSYGAGYPMCSNSLQR